MWSSDLWISEPLPPSKLIYSLGCIGVEEVNAFTYNTVDLLIFYNYSHRTVPYRTASHRTARIAYWKATTKRSTRLKLIAVLSLKIQRHSMVEGKMAKYFMTRPRNSIAC